MRSVGRQKIELAAEHPMHTNKGINIISSREVTFTLHNIRKSRGWTRREVKILFQDLHYEMTQFNKAWFDIY